MTTAVFYMLRKVYPLCSSSRCSVLSINSYQKNTFTMPGNFFQRTVTTPYKFINWNMFHIQSFKSGHSVINMLSPGCLKRKYELLRNVRICSCTAYQCYSYTSERRKYTSRIQEALKRKESLEKSFKKRKDRFKRRSQVLLQDIKETRDKMKEKMEEVIQTENIWTIPNLLCVSRIALSPVLGYLIIHSNYNLAFGLLVVAGVTDLLDGWIARTYKNQSSHIGSFLDPAADKILVAILFLSLTYMDLIPVLLTGTIVIRDSVLVGAGFYIRYQSLPPPRTISRYFDATHATAKLSPTFLGKANTAIQLVMVATTLAAPVFNYVDHPVLHFLWYLTATTTITSALSYLYSKETYKYLRKKN